MELLSLEEKTRRFVKDTSALIDLEQKEERDYFERLMTLKDAKELEVIGIAITKVKLRNIKAGLYRKFLLSFEDAVQQPQSKEKEEEKNADGENIRRRTRFGSLKFGTGDLVGVYDNGIRFEGKPLISGVIYRVKSTKIVLSVDEMPDEPLDERELSMVIMANDVTYRRYKDAITALSSAVENPYHPSRKLLETCFMPDTERKLGKFEGEIIFSDPSLNEEQKEAVRMALGNDNPVALVHGPPGTGKTKTICEVITQAARRKLRVLACAPSNIAVDNIVERLAKNDVKVCRLGHPARLLPTVVEKSLDALLSKTEAFKNVKKLNREIKKLEKKIPKAKDKGTRGELRSEIYQLNKEIKGAYQEGLNDIFREVDVLLATNAGASGWVIDAFAAKLRNKAFDLVVIDEAAQALEISCWIPLLRASRAILAGDHKQLPPTIKSKEAESKGLNVTLFDRLSLRKDIPSFMLKVQYRMNKLIMQWSSAACYNGQLVAATSVAEHTLKDITEGKEDTLAISGEPTLITCQDTILMMIDTAGVKMGENLDESEETFSKSNVGEADLVRLLYEELKKQGIEDKDIGIISPYNAQVELIKKTMEDRAGVFRAEVSTVDGFQGREKEIIIITMVRSNPEKKVGFLGDYRRMNVAVTRAKRFVAIICDSATVSSDKFLKEMVEYFRVNGEVRNAAEFVALDDTIRCNVGYIDKKTGGGVGVTTINAEGQKKTVTLDVDVKKKKKKEKKKKNKTDTNGQQGNEKEDEDDKEEETKDVLNEQSEQESETEKALLVLLESVKKFRNDPKAVELAFSPALNSYHRMKLHEEADKLGLEHVSKGAGAERHLVLFKPGVQKAKEQPTAEAAGKETQQKKKEKLPTASAGTKGGVVIGGTGKRPAYMDEAEEEEKIENKEEKNILPASKPPQEDKALTQKAAQEKIAKKAKAKEEKNAKKKKEEEIDDDDFLDALIQSNKFCAFTAANGARCDKKIEMLGITCKYCSSVFCMKHSHAEDHGCGNRASQVERQAFRDNFAASQGPYGNKPMKEGELEYLKQKLAKKLDERQEHKTVTTKKNNKKK